MLKMFLMKPSRFDLFSIPSELWEWRNKVIFNLNLNVLLGGGKGEFMNMEFMLHGINLWWFSWALWSETHWLSNSYLSNFSSSNCFMHLADGWKLFRCVRAWKIVVFRKTLCVCVCVSIKEPHAAVRNRWVLLYSAPSIRKWLMRAGGNDAPPDFDLPTDTLGPHDQMVSAPTL